MKFDVIRMPTNGQLWLMGAVGLFSMFTFGTAEAGRTIENGDAFGKLGQAFIPFAVMPFLIPFAGIFGEQRRFKKSTILYLVVYFCFLLIAALMRNSRGAFMTIFVIVGFCLILAVLIGALRITRKGLSIVAVVGVVCIPIISAFSELATAMVIARSVRSDVSATELVASTFEAFMDKNAINSRRFLDSIIDGSYNEVYIDNVFLARFIYTKFADLNFYQSSELTDDDVAKARSIFIDKTLATLPTPILNAFHIDVDKSNVAFSGGDTYRYLSGRGDVGGYTTGSSIADGIIVLDGFFWPIYVVIILSYFFLYDSLSVQNSKSKILVSPLILMILPTLFSESLMRDGLSVQVGSLTRGYFQSILLYFFLSKMSQFLVLKQTRRDMGS